MKTLKEKTIHGVFWSSIQNFSIQISTLIIGIVLARILTPREFGLIGMLTIFIALSNVLINGGLMDALIRNPDCTKEDYSTAFFFNLVVSITLYFILFISADWISYFFEEDQLKSLIRVLSLTLVINAFTLIQKTKLTKEINFKLMTKIDLIAVVSSGIIAIGIAWYGFGVWSLVANTLLISILSVLMYWSWSRWAPILTFNKSSFKKMFSFGSRLAILGVIDTIYLNMYHLIIGKVYSADQLGFYTQANRFKNFPSAGIIGIVQRVTYPVLSEMQNDKIQLKNAYQKLVKVISLISISMLFGLAAISKNLIVLLLGGNWIITGEYLQIMCFVVMFSPFDALNTNMLKVAGHSHTVLNIGILRKFMAIPVILAAIFWGIKPMLYVMFIHQFFSFWLISYYGGQTISYGSWKQLRDAIPSIIISLVMFLTVSIIPNYLNFDLAPILLLQIIMGVAISMVLFELLKVDGYLYLKKTFLDKLKSIIHK